MKAETGVFQEAQEVAAFTAKLTGRLKLWCASKRVATLSEPTEHKCYISADHRSRHSDLCYVTANEQSSLILFSSFQNSLKEIPFHQT